MKICSEQEHIKSTDLHHCHWSQTYVCTGNMSALALSQRVMSLCSLHSDYSLITDGYCVRSQLLFCMQSLTPLFPAVPWHCWLGDKKAIQSVITYAIIIHKSSLLLNKWREKTGGWRDSSGKWTIKHAVFIQQLTQKNQMFRGLLKMFSMFFKKQNYWHKTQNVYDKTHCNNQ